MGDKANLVGDQYEVTWGNLTPFVGTVNVGSLLTFKPVTANQTGDDILAHLVNGRTPVVQIVVKELTVALMQKFVGLSGGNMEAPAVGSQMPTDTLRLHPVAKASDDDFDWHFFAVVCSDVSESSDGRDEKEYTITLTAERDSSGKVFRIGAPA